MWVFFNLTVFSCLRNTLQSSMTLSPSPTSTTVLLSPSKSLLNTPCSDFPSTESNQVKEVLVDMVKENRQKSEKLMNADNLGKELFHVLVLTDHTKIQIKLLRNWSILRFSFRILSSIKNPLLLMDVICVL